jgi:hypothetical protein
MFAYHFHLSCQVNMYKLSQLHVAVYRDHIPRRCRVVLRFEGVICKLSLQLAAGNAKQLHMLLSEQALTQLVVHDRVAFVSACELGLAVILQLLNQQTRRSVVLQWPLESAGNIRQAIVSLFRRAVHSEFEVLCTSRRITA